MMEYRKTSSGLLIPKMVRQYPIAFDFFAGAGGFSLGLIMAGFEVIGACEIDCSAAHTYMMNLGNYPIQIHYTNQDYRNKLEQYFEGAIGKFLKKNPGKIVTDFSLAGNGWRKSQRESGNFYPGVSNFFFGSIRELTGAGICAAMGIEVGELDLVVGGPPCQGFSIANNKKRDKKAHDPRNTLVFEYARMLSEMQPKSFVMEEVPEILRMRTAAGVPVIDQFLRILEDGNYMSYEAAMKALNIREKDIGKKPTYVVRPGKNNIDRSQKKKPAVQQKKSELTLF